MGSPDCYFVTYADGEGGVRIAPLCLGCRALAPEQEAMFWDGSVRGYKADSRFACKNCGTVIHEPETHETENSAEVPRG